MTKYVISTILGDHKKYYMVAPSGKVRTSEGRIVKQWAPKGVKPGAEWGRDYHKAYIFTSHRAAVREANRNCGHIEIMNW